MPNQPFSVLMSVYNNENPSYFLEALDSCLKQTILPDEIVLVKDGPLKNGLENVIKKYNLRFANKLKVIPLKHNVGLGEALRIGLEACSHEIIARTDSDDINMPDRFRIQLRLLQEHQDIHVVGSWIAEFENSPQDSRYIRKVPLAHSEIEKKAIYRNPMNHMSVMFKKNAVLYAGNYISFLWFEDYYLWARMLMKGFRFANIPEVLVKVRADKKMLLRRTGLRYLKSELNLQFQFLKMGFISQSAFVFNIIIRSIVRIIPGYLRRIVYKKVFRDTQ